MRDIVDSNIIMITIHGKIKMEYGGFVVASKEASKTRRELISNGSRDGCYKALLGERFHKAFAKTSGEYDPENDSEIFDPLTNYPDHYDSGGISYVLAFQNGCSLTVDGIHIRLEPWCIYSFEESLMHNSKGMLFMCKPKSD